MKNKKSRIVALSAVFILLSVGCRGSDSPIDTTTVPKENRLTGKQREELVPNPLFIAVFNSEAGKVNEVLRKSPELLRSTNIEFGETPFGMALRLEQEQIAGELLAQMSLEDLYALNNAKESYVFLAARAGYARLIRAMADRLFYSLGTLSRFDFSTLDQRDSLGRTALFVARDRNTALALQDQMYRGFLMHPWWSFFQVLDEEHRSFLHWAAIENRRDIIEWAAEALCKNEATMDEGWIAWAGRHLNDVHNFLRFQTGDLTYLPGDQIVNRTDKTGRTALHYAADRLSVEAIRSLQSCALLDPFVKDKEGNTYLHLYLNALEKRATTLPQNLIDMILPMANFESGIQALYYKRLAILDVANNEGRVPQHIAALLNDGRPFQILRSLRNVTTPDKSGLSPERLRERVLQQRSETR